MKLLAILEKNRQFWFLLGACIVFFFLRFPSLFEPYWYGDEGIYETIGYALRNGRMLYSGIWDNKPPLLYITYAIFSGDQFAAKLLSLIVGIATVVVFYFLAKKLFEQTYHAAITTSVFVLLFGLPLLEGNIANAENFMQLFIISAGILVLNTVNKYKSLLLFLAGILLGIAFLYKIVAVFDTAAFGSFLLIVTYKNVKHIGRQIIKVTPLALGFIAPVILTAAFFLVHGIFKDFYKGAFVQNVGYVGYGNTFIIPQGLLISKLLLLIIIIGILFVWRKKVTTTELFIYLWSAFSLFNAFFSQRPYTHYVLVIIASFSLLVGLLFWKNAKQKFSFLSAVVIVILVVMNFNLYAKNISYYRNFLQYTFGNKSTTAYESFFDPNAVRDAELASYIKTLTKPNEVIFLWGNSAEIYKVSRTLPPGRYTVAYHITTSQQTLHETENDLQKTQPKIIIILQNAPAYPYNLTTYQPVMGFQNAVVFERTE